MLQISKGKSQQWKLILEHRSYGYNWLHQIRAQNDKDKRDSFMSYIKQLSKDKITLFIQGGSKGILEKIKNIEVQSTAHQTIYFEPCTAFITRA
jgi:hypothetical protein